jgi:hypothetical protein
MEEPNSVIILIRSMGVYLVSNPFPPRNPNTFGIRSVTAGVRKSSGSSGPSGPLPAFANVGFWYDPTQPVGNIWADNPGTIPITDNTLIAFWSNLGFTPYDLDDTPSQRWFAAGGPNNLPYIGTGASFGAATPVHPAMGPNGTSWFGLGSHPTAAGSQGTIGMHKSGGLGGQILAQTIPAGPPFIRMDFCGTGFQTLNGVSLNTDWYWIWATIDAAGNWRMQLSGQSEINGVAVYNPPGANSFLRMGGVNSDTGESAIWPNYVLTNQDITDLISYLDVKYSGPFPLP